MAIMVECSRCGRRQSLKNKGLCKAGCREHMAKARQAGRVKYWVADYLPGKKLRWTPAGDTLEDAKTVEADLRLKKKRVQPDALRGQRTTFNDITAWYLKQDCVTGQKSSWLTKIRIATFNKRFGNWPVNRITVTDLRNYQAKLKVGDKKEEIPRLGPATINQTFKKIKAMVNLAYGAKEISSDVFAVFHDRSFRPLRLPNKGARNRILMQEEFFSLLHHADGHLFGILMTGFYAGMRRGEIVRLTWDRVDLPRRVISLWPADTKTGEGRTIPINTDLLCILENWPTRPAQGDGKGEYVFTYQGRPIKGNIRDGLKKACAAAGILYGRDVEGGFVLHDLRRTFATYMADAGHRGRVIQAVAGWLSPEMLDRYDCPTPVTKQKAVDSLPSLPGGITRGINMHKEEDPSEEGPSFTTA